MSRFVAAPALLAALPSSSSAWFAASSGDAAGGAGGGLGSGAAACAFLGVSPLWSLPPALVFVTYHAVQKQRRDRAAAIGVCADPRVLELVMGASVFVFSSEDLSEFRRHPSS